MCIGIAGNWFYDMLLLRLASDDIELKLFPIDKHQKEAHQNNEANLYILASNYLIFIRDEKEADSTLLLISKTFSVYFVARNILL